MAHIAPWFVHVGQASGHVSTATKEHCLHAGQHDKHLCCSTAATPTTHSSQDCITKLHTNHSGGRVLHIMVGSSLPVGRSAGCCRAPLQRLVLAQAGGTYCIDASIRTDKHARADSCCESSPVI